MVGIRRGLLHPPHICATLQFLEVPPQNWPLAVESTVLASVNAFYFLHRVRFGGPSERGLCATGCDNAEQEADPLLQKQNFRKFTGFFPTFFSKKFIAAMQASGEV